MCPGDSPGFERWALWPLCGRVSGWSAPGEGGLHLEGPWQTGAPPEARPLSSRLPTAGAGAMPAPGLGNSGGLARRVELDFLRDESRIWPVRLPQTKCSFGQVGNLIRLNEPDTPHCSMESTIPALFLGVRCTLMIPWPWRVPCLESSPWKNL